MSFGKEIVASLKDFIARADGGESFKQTVVRRMKVKGKTVYTFETFNAPLKPWQKPQDAGR